MGKRLFDISFSFLGFLCLSPVFLVIAVFIYLEDGAPILFKQKRIGKHGTPFILFKFRSMRISNKGLQITTSHDPRITKTGAFIRKTKLDELPQLWNILNGSMSFVGPRPEVEKYVKLYSALQKEVLHVKPGLTGLASLTYSNESELLSNAKDPEEFYIKELLPKKTELDLQYVKNNSLKIDLLIIIRTVKKVFF